jgi:hypothetical protein
MSKLINDGGPAFPATEANGCNNGVPGMTLRDYFAAKADLSSFRDEDGSLSAFSAKAVMGAPPPIANTSPLDVVLWWAEAEARLRLIYADAMLKARK